MTGFRAAPLLAIGKPWPVSSPVHPVQDPGVASGLVGQGTDVTARVMDFGGKQTWLPSLAGLPTPGCDPGESLYFSESWFPSFVK